MGTVKASHTQTLEPADARRLANLCGQLNQHLRQIEQRFHVEVRNRSSVFSFYGDTLPAKAAGKAVDLLYHETGAGQELTPEKVHLILQTSGAHNMTGHNMTDNARNTADNTTVIRTRKELVKPRGVNQQHYVQSIQQHDINFGVGPAGTGKTWLAVACAVEALNKEKVERIILVRPAVEAGEKLGFLPGDLAQKIDPYLRPLYDALHEMLGYDMVAKLQEKNVIEIAPLAYMRGRTLNNAFIILDESQNATRAQMKMFLTRIGFGSTAVITGDTTQIDLPRKDQSGLLHACEVLHKVEGISFTFFESSDVVRHPLVQLIVDAYADHDIISGND